MTSAGTVGFVVVAEDIYSFIEFGFFAHISFTFILSVNGLS